MQLAQEQLRRFRFRDTALFIRGAVAFAIGCTWKLETAVWNGITGGLSRDFMKSLHQWRDHCPICLQKIDVDAKTSVGHLDPRSGDRSARVGVADNRRYAFFCFAAFGGILSSNSRWDSSLGPFFFFYADVFHAECKHLREKEGEFDNVMEVFW